MSSNLINVRVVLDGGVQVDVTGEPTSHPCLAITPAVGIDRDAGDVFLCSYLVLTHVPTGLLVGTPDDRSTVWGAPIREAVDRIASMVSWETTPTQEEAREIYAVCQELAAEHRKGGVTIHA